MILRVRLIADQNAIAPASDVKTVIDGVMENLHPDADVTRSVIEVFEDDVQILFHVGTESDVPLIQRRVSDIPDSALSGTKQVTVDNDWTHPYNEFQSE